MAANKKGRVPLGCSVLAVFFLCAAVFVFIAWLVPIGEGDHVAFVVIFLVLAGGCWWLPVWAGRIAEKDRELSRVGIVQAESRLELIMWIFGIVFGGAGVLIVCFETDPRAIFIGGGALAAGVPCLIKALVETFRRKKFGASTLKLTSFPATSDGILVGVIQTRCPSLPPADGYRLSLKCIACDSDGGKDSAIVLWEKRVVVVDSVFDRDTFRVAIPVDFRIPADYLPKGFYDSRGTFWRLEVFAKVPGLKYRVSFLVPDFSVKNGYGKMW